MLVTISAAEKMTPVDNMGDLVCVVIAETYGAARVSRRIFCVQAVPALARLAAPWLLLIASGGESKIGAEISRRRLLKKKAGFFADRSPCLRQRANPPAPVYLSDFVPFQAPAPFFKGGKLT